MASNFLTPRCLVMQENENSGDYVDALWGLVFDGICGGWVDVLRVFSSFSNTSFLEKGLSCPPSSCFFLLLGSFRGESVEVNTHNFIHPPFAWY